MTVIKRDGRWTIDFWYEGKRYGFVARLLPETRRAAREVGSRVLAIGRQAAQ